MSFGNRYQVFRYDRPHRGGGVCILVQRHLQVVQVDLNLPGEFVILDIKGMSMSFRALCCYVPTFGASQARLERVKQICTVMLSAVEVDGPVVVTGDFNLPKIDWHAANFPDKDTPEDAFMNVCSKCNLFQLISNPTHAAGNLLDLLLVTDPDIIKDVNLCASPIPSDHFLVRFSILCQIGTPQYSPRPNFFKMNESMIDFHLNSINWASFFSGYSNVNGMFVRFVDCSSFLIGEFTPKAAQESSVDEIKSYIERLNLRLLSSPNDTKLAKKLSRASIRYRCILENNLNLKNPRSFYRYVNSRVKNSSSVGTLKHGPTVYCTPSSKAHALASHFASIFVSETVPEIHSHQINSSSSITHSPDSPVEFSVQNIYNLLVKLKSSIADTPDHIPAIFYRKFALFLAEPLSMIYERSYSEATVPFLFRESIVTPIHKKGSKSEISNYRPIAQGC